MIGYAFVKVFMLSEYSQHRLKFFNRVCILLRNMLPRMSPIKKLERQVRKAKKKLEQLEEKLKIEKMLAEFRGKPPMVFPPDSPIFLPPWKEDEWGCRIDETESEEENWLGAVSRDNWPCNDEISQMVAELVAQ